MQDREHQNNKLSSSPASNSEVSPMQTRPATNFSIDAIIGRNNIGESGIDIIRPSSQSALNAIDRRSPSPNSLNKGKTL